MFDRVILHLRGRNSIYLASMFNDFEYLQSNMRGIVIRLKTRKDPLERESFLDRRRGKELKDIICCTQDLSFGRSYQIT
jgi:hypothetical protein